MANNLFVSYDLNSPSQDYSSVIEVIKSLGNWAHVQESLWYVNSNLSAEEAANKVWAAMDSSDSLIVIEANSNNAYWFNLSDEVAKQIQGEWYK